ncbi:MAG: response regulator [Candidatus Heimdallarchaeaceae archaeon]
MARIFIVDDEESIQFLYKEGLSLRGHEIVGFAYNGDEAIDFLRKQQEKPDIIILDHRMPIKNGVDTLKEIIEEHLAPESKIIFISADPNIKMRVLNLGVAMFIQKPFSLVQLLNKLETMK